jgi:hypothetical protein
MKADYGLTKIGPVQVGIDLGSGDRFVSQHFLNRAQIGPAFDQVGCK